MTALDTARAEAARQKMLKNTNDAKDSVGQLATQLRAFTRTYVAAQALAPNDDGGATLAAIKTDVLEAVATAIATINGWDSQLERNALFAGLLRISASLSVDITKISALELETLRQGVATLDATLNPA